MDKLNILELFSGIGGMHYALKQSNIPGEIFTAIEINPIANKVYSYNFPNTSIQNRNVQFLTEKYIEKHKINTILMSPPCQPFTRVGNQKDLEDSRTNALIFLCELIPKLNSIEKILMENVKGFEISKAHNLYIKSIKNAGFYYREFLLSPTCLGIPNSRLRYYCIARKSNDFNFDSNNEILLNLPNQINENRIELRKIKDFLEENLNNPPIISDEILLKRSQLMDISYPESTSSTCFTKAYSRYIEGTGSVFSHLEKNEIKQIFEKRNENDNEFLVELKKLNLRFFTPREVARLMSFPDSFRFPDDVTENSKYRLLGNSLNILVVSELIKLLCL